MSAHKRAGFWTKVIADPELMTKINAATEGKSASEMPAAVCETGYGEGFDFTPEELVATHPIQAASQGLSEGELNQKAGGVANDIITPGPGVGLPDPGLSVGTPTLLDSFTGPSTPGYSIPGSLPLLYPLKAIPAGTPLSDLQQPWMIVLVPSPYGYRDP